MTIRDQISFAGSVDCDKFRPNQFRPNFCTECSQKIEQHCAGAVTDETDIVRALEYSSEAASVPSAVYTHPEGGVLYLGGFQAALNVEFLTSNNVRMVVNTAKGLEVFGPKYTAGVEKRKTEVRGLDVVELWWVDNEEQVLEQSLVVFTAQKIERALSLKRSVLVHCAMGRSRSTAMVLAYLAPKLGATVDAALEEVQKNRMMAQPNENFMSQLRKMKLDPSILVPDEGDKLPAA